MRLSLNFILFASLFISSVVFGQQKDDTTVFITSTEKLKTTKDKYEDGYFFSQYALTFSFVGNPDSGEYNYDTQENEPMLMSEGLGGYASIGAHYHKWIGIAANTGLDYKFSYDLLSLPLYGSIISYLHFNDDSGFYLEGGYGATFSINKSLQPGNYQKYKLGVIIEERLSIYLDYSIIDFNQNQHNNVESFGIGISMINFW